MISNYHSLETFGYFDNLLLSSDTESGYTLFEEIDITPYTDGYLVNEVSYVCPGVRDTPYPPEEIGVESEDYLFFEEVYPFSLESTLPLSFQRVEKPETPTEESFERMYAFLEELIVNLMYGYLEEDSYPERDYLVYEEIDSIQSSRHQPALLTVE
jgi:hypothetical protein